MSDDKAGRVIRDRIARAKAIAGYFPKFNPEDVDVHSLADLTARMAHDAKVLDALVGEALQAGSDPLPAQSPTEDQIVAALKADPAMAGRVMSKFASRANRVELDRCRDEARFSCEAGFPLHDGYTALQSLAVALAAASYRG